MRLSILSQGLQASAILRIAGEVRELARTGQEIADLTVGDFSSKYFPIPRALEDGIVDALRAGETTYPPPIGLESLRQAVRDFYRHRTGQDFPLESILIASGARPAIYGVYRAVVDPGDRVVFGVPSWNNDYYCQILGAHAVPVPCDPSTGFLPTAAALRPVIRGARLLALNSPLNPTGTMFDAEQLGAICDLVLEENARRTARERPLYVMYDQVYWMITAAGMQHADPIALRPAMAPYTVLVDAVSKAFSATGIRVGWAAGPPDVIRAMNDVVGHVGAWAPRAEQVGTARFLADHDGVDSFLSHMRGEVEARLQATYDGLSALRADGLPVECIRPQGAIYVSARFALHGRRTPDGRTLVTDDDVRRYLLNAAGLAVVPFAAFGSPGDDGWFRLSVGVVTVEQLRAVMPRLRSAIRELSS